MRKPKLPACTIIVATTATRYEYGRYIFCKRNGLYRFQCRFCYIVPVFVAGLKYNNEYYSGEEKQKLFHMFIFSAPRMCGTGF